MEISRDSFVHLTKNGLMAIEISKEVLYHYFPVKFLFLL